MKTLWLYIKANIFIYATYIVIAIICLTVGFLYELPAEPILYSFLLSFIMVMTVEIVRYIRFYRRHAILEMLKKEADVSIANLPHPVDLIEEDYQNVVRTLNDAKNNIASDYDMKMTDMKDYYSMWAHQIKTPIAAMNLILQCDETEHSENLENQLFKIEQYVDMVMQYLRADSISGDMIISEYKLDDIIKAAVRKYRKQFISKRITLDYNDVGCTVITDEKWMQFVIEQVISNALKYTRSGTISIYMDEKLPSTLVIEDTGIGIREEDLPRIFESGFTGYNGREDKKSTGIGLYLCRKILKKLSHTITAESVLDKGTSIKIGLERPKIKYE